jgi:hypothetical protein
MCRCGREKAKVLTRDKRRLYLGQKVFRGGGGVEYDNNGATASGDESNVCAINFEVCGVVCGIHTDVQGG